MGRKRSNLDLNKFIDLHSRKSSGNLFQINAPYSRNVFAIIGFGKRQLKSRSGAPSIIGGPHFGIGIQVPYCCTP